MGPDDLRLLHQLRAGVADAGHPRIRPDAKLLLFLVIVDQLSDVLQYVWGKLAGRHPIAPSISPNKTWEGFLGGVLSATAIGTALWWLTPFTPAVAAAISLLITLLGFAGRSGDVGDQAR